MTNRILTISFLVFLNIILFTSISGAESKEIVRDLTSQPITSSRCNEFTFDASGSYDPDDKNISYLWDLGDGTKSSKAVIDHTYDKAGEYIVTLEIKDDSGLECSTSITKQKILVSIPPEAEIKSEDEACVNEPITFNASSSSDRKNKPLYYYWDFGDGTKAEGKNIVVKKYDRGGTFTVTLTVDERSGNACGKKKISKQVTIHEAPKAEAGDEMLLQCASNPGDYTINFDASGSSSMDNEELKYYWDFGDGKKGKGMSIDHKFPDVGNYFVKLEVKDKSGMKCDTGVDVITVKINEQPSADAGEDALACIGDEALFDGSNSYAKIKGTLFGTWDFGDGQTANGMIVKHAYNKSGKYQASLKVENKLNTKCAPSTDIKNVVINTPPEVKIKAVDSVCLGSKVDFDASSAKDPDGDKLEFYWSFGDGNILRSGPKVSHEYKQGGTYRVSVIVDDGKETACSTATASTTVKVNTPPKADAGPNHVCCLNKEASFDARASSDPDGDDLTYSWDFGDGIKTTGAVVNHTYKKSGQYNVFLSVDDNSGTSCNKDTAGFIAEVNAAPVPIIKIK